MKQPFRIVVAASRVFAVLLLFLFSLHVKAATKPNIVVFIADDHSQLDSQAYGSTEVRTPNMAKLAAEGLKFTHAFVASPSCGPSRTALLTGLWSARNGAEPNHKPNGKAATAYRSSPAGRERSRPAAPRLRRFPSPTSWPPAPP